MLFLFLDFAYRNMFDAILLDAIFIPRFCFSRLLISNKNQTT
jgi:hypothetical protein